MHFPQAQENCGKICGGKGKEERLLLLKFGTDKTVPRIKVKMHLGPDESDNSEMATSRFNPKAQMKRKD